MNKPAAAAIIAASADHADQIHAATGDTHGSLGLAAAMLDSCIDRCNRADAATGRATDNAANLATARDLIADVLAALIA